MIAITLNIDTGRAALEMPTTVKLGVPEPVVITLNRDPGDGGAPGFQLALGPDSTPISTLAFADTFEAESATVYRGTLNLNDTRLIAWMSGKNNVSVNCEIAWNQGDGWLAAPNVSITVQQRIITGPESSSGGPVYALESDISGFTGDIIVGDKTITFERGLVKNIQ